MGNKEVFIKRYNEILIEKVVDVFVDDLEKKLIEKQLIEKGFTVREKVALKENLIHFAVTLSGKLENIEADQLAYILRCLMSGSEDTSKLTTPAAQDVLDDLNSKQESEIAFRS